MAKLRHLALVVHDLERAKAFYEKLFDMKVAVEVKGTAVHLTDGVMNLALLDYKTVNRPGSKTADGREGLHHFGFRVGDLEATQAAIEAAGGTYCFDFGDPNSMNYERKFTDPEGVLFDISHKGWYGALDETIETSPARAAE